MDTRKLLAFGLIVLGLIGAASMASAISLTDGNDGVYFAGETITMTNWDNCTQRYTYMWIVNGSNRTQAYVGSSTTTNLTAGAEISGNLSSSCTFVINTTALMVNTARSAQTYYIYLRATYDSTSPNISSVASVNPDAFVDLNNFTLSISPSRTNGYGVVPGDNTTVVIITSGPSSAATREGATYTVTTTESGATPVKADTTADGNITYKITAQSAAVDQANVSVTNGYASGTGTYAVRQFNIQAYDRTANTAQGSKVILETLNESGARANYQTSAGGNLTFALTVSGLANNYWDNGASNLTINWSFNDVNVSTVTTVLNVNTTTGTGTITASCVNFTLTDSDTYTVNAATANITITGTNLNGTTATTFYIGQNATIAGWINNVSQNVTLNVSLVNDTALNIVNKTLEIIPLADGTWSMNWSTNANWSFTSFTNPANALPTGTYRVTAWKTNNVGENVSTDITITDALSITTLNSTYNGVALTNEVYVDGILTIQGASSRLNGTKVLSNITGTSYMNITNLSSVAGAALLGTNGTYSIAWNTSNANATGTYTILVSNRVTTATTTVTVKDNLTINNLPDTGPTGANITINGSTTRVNGTAINMTVKDGSGIVVLNASVGGTTASGGAWGYVWNTTQNGIGSSNPLVAGTYTVNVTDGVVSTTDTITIGTGSITSIAVSESSIFVDKQLNISGTTNYPQGTVVTVFVTNCTNVTTVLKTTTTTVDENQTFNTTWTPSANAAAIKENLTSLAAGVPANVCVYANKSTANTSTQVALKVNLAMTSASSVLTGDQLLLTGTTSRSNGTKIEIHITQTGSNYNITRFCLVGNQNPAYTSGTFTNDTYNATIDGGGGANLSAGTFTITVNDSLVSNTATFTVTTTETLAITSPTANQSISIGDLFNITGTSNRANGTSVTVTITGISVGSNMTSTTVTGTVNTSGLFSASWPTVNYTAGQYILSASTGTAGSQVVYAYLTAATTTTTTTTSAGATTTTTLAGACVMPGNSEPCDTVTLSEVVAAVNAWSAGTMDLADVIDLINSWSNSTQYPPE